MAKAETRRDTRTLTSASKDGRLSRTRKPRHSSLAPPRTPRPSSPRSSQDAPPLGPRSSQDAPPLTTSLLPGRPAHPCPHASQSAPPPRQSLLPRSPVHSVLSLPRKLRPRDPHHSQDAPPHSRFPSPASPRTSRPQGPAACWDWKSVCAPRRAQAQCSGPVPVAEAGSTRIKTQLFVLLFTRLGVSAGLGASRTQGTFGSRAEVELTGRGGASRLPSPLWALLCI